jgi:hypothetical protein
MMSSNVSFLPSHQKGTCTSVIPNLEQASSFSLSRACLFCTAPAGDKWGPKKEGRREEREREGGRGGIREDTEWKEAARDRQEEKRK